MSQESKIKNSKAGRIVLLLGGAIIIVLIIQCEIILNSLSFYFKCICEMPHLFHCISGLAMFIALLHLMLVPKGGIAKEHVLYKRLGPILSTPLTCLTYGVFIYCGLLVIYIVCYDEATLMKYTNLDKTTVSFTMLVLMTYSFYGMSLIISDIVNPKEESSGRILPEEQIPLAETDNENPNENQ